MAFNKSKALENALKFLNQGKVPQAIAEYQLILRADPRDQATLMTVGDLFARQGDLPHAIEYFERLAQVYLGDGFNSKAIAIYKKIAKLAPNELAPLERLADLYVQQGVLSEARPLFLQIAEAHLKANHAQKGVEVLHRLLDVEPENQRVQMRLAELYGMMGQKKEAAVTYLNYAQRLFERGEAEEAEKLVERSLEMEPTSSAAVLLKAKTLSQTNKLDAAISALEGHPEANAGGEVTNLLVDLELRTGKSAQAAKRARHLMSAAPGNYLLLYQVVETLIESNQAEQALPLLGELRAPMVEHGAQENYLKTLSAAAAALPAQTQPLEMLVDFCRHASEPFHLNASLGQLSDVYAAQGNFQRAEELLVELVDRNKNDERLVERLNQLRARAGGSAMPAPELVEPTVPGPNERFEEQPVAEVPVSTEESLDEETQQYIAQALTDVDLFSSYGLTQKATHLLENVLQKAPRHTPTLERLLDLYLGAGNDRRTAELSSQLEQIHRERNDNANADRFGELSRRYSKVAGIAPEDLPPVPAKPAVPIETVREAAPAQAPFVAETIAREVAKQTPPIEVVQAPAEAAPEPAPFEIEAVPDQPAAPASEPQALEFEVPLVNLELDTVDGAPTIVIEDAAPVEAASGTTDELDLSDEWEAISRDVDSSETASELPAQAIAAETASVELDPIVEPEAAESVDEPILIEESSAPEQVAESAPSFDEEPEPAPKFQPFQIEENMPQSAMLDEPGFEVPVEPAPMLANEPEAEQASVFEIAAESTTEVPVEQDFEIPVQHAAELASPATAHGPAAQPDVADIFSLLDEPVTEAEVPGAELATPEVASEDAGIIEIDLTPESAPAQKTGAATTEDFISELVAELEDLEAPSSEPAVGAAAPEKTHEALVDVFASVTPAPIAAATVPPVAGKVPATSNGKSATPPEILINADPPPSVESLNQLADVFQEFRAELGEMSDEDEDLETHYNLGIAYREMGLLDEAIGEFQKVAKAIQKGKPFRYVMNCSTMLGLTFMDKGEPKVASHWYQKALETPGLEEESILALRYDLGMALEAAGESNAALDTFRTVYAVNIDYRDVADRIATIQKR
jgi:tetratricopeptide (TPR) repeat protein